MATSKPSGTNCPKSSFRSTAPPPKEKCGSSNTICKQKQSKRVSKKRKKQGQKNQTSEPEVSHSQHVKSISSKTERTKGQKVKRSKRPKEVKPVPSKSTKGATAPPQPKTNGHQPSKSSPRAKDNQAVIAAGSHLFPSRTEKLSPPAPMVLHTSVGE